MAEQLPVSYVLLPKRYKETKIIKIIFNIQFAVTKQLPGSYLLLTKKI